MDSKITWSDADPDVKPSELALVCCESEVGIRVVVGYYHFGKWHYNSGFPIKEKVKFWARIPLPTYNCA